MRFRRVTIRAVMGGVAFAAVLSWLTVTARRVSRESGDSIWHAWLRHRRGRSPSTGTASPERSGRGTGGRCSGGPGRVITRANAGGPPTRTLWNWRRPRRTGRCCGWSGCQFPTRGPSTTASRPSRYGGQSPGTSSGSPQWRPRRRRRLRPDGSSTARPQSADPSGRRSPTIRNCFATTSSSRRGTRKPARPLAASRARPAGAEMNSVPQSEIWGACLPVSPKN